MTQGMHWIFPSVGSAIFGFGIGGLGDVALCVLIDSYEAVSVPYLLMPCVGADSL